MRKTDQLMSLSILVIFSKIWISRGLRSVIPRLPTFIYTGSSHKKYPAPADIRGSANLSWRAGRGYSRYPKPDHCPGYIQDHIKETTASSWRPESMVLRVKIKFMEVLWLWSPL